MDCQLIDNPITYITEKRRRYLVTGWTKGGTQRDTKVALPVEFALHGDI